MKIKSKHILFTVWVVIPLLLLGGIPVSEELITGKIVFVSDRSGNKDIYVMNADGTHVVQLTQNSARDWNPAWSPDGTKIAFVSDRGWGTNIYVMDTQGNNIIQLTYGFAANLNPAWSPDGTKIAFDSNRDGHSQIYIMNADGSNIKKITHDNNRNRNPVWSPDGEKIAYNCLPVSELFSEGIVVPKIRVVHSDGSNITELSEKRDFDPVWSSDGTKIVFNSNRDGNFEIYTMNSDGTEQKRLTYHSDIDDMASWALNGEKIFFVSDRDGDKEIYLMDTDGNNAVQVTINSFQDDEPDWHENIHGYSASKMISHKNIDDVNAVQVVVPPDSEKVGISGIGIRYELHGTHGDVWEYWIGLHDDGNYYVDMVSSMFSATASKGQRVDIKYIQKLAASFTDFYETERILRYEGMRFDGSVNFEVLVTLENGETFTMNTPPDYEKCCFIPWSIVYKNKEYMQSNGKITHAVLRLLNELDEDEEIQIVFDKWISWGCYPGDLYFAYCDDELSDDFPQSKDELTAVEELGKSHVQWEVDISGIVGPAAYGNGAIYIATTESVICINTKSRKKIWETPIEFDGNGKGTIVVDGEFVYAGIPPNIYKINGKTGGLVWKFTLDNTDRDSIQIIPVNDLLIVWDKTGWVEGKISCLAAENGDVIWEIPEEVGFLGVVNNAVLYKIEKNWKDYTYTYELVNITSGKKIWQKGSSRYVHWNSKIKNWSYYEGILYVCKEDEGTVVAVDMETMEESVVYSHRKFTSEFETGNLVQYCQVYEEGILLSIIEFGDIGWSISRWDTRIVFLDRNGNEIWEYRYDEKSVGSFYCVRKGFSFGFEYNPVEYAEIDQDTLFLVRENGFFEAFHIETGKKLWENEIRDSVNKVLISNHKIYAAAKDCKVYCLNMDGDIIWEVKACDNLCTVCVDSDPVRFYGDAHILCDCEHLIDAVWIGEEILLVTTENKLIGVSWQY